MSGLSVTTLQPSPVSVVAVAAGILFLLVVVAMPSLLFNFAIPTHVCEEQPTQCEPGSTAYIKVSLYRP